MGFFYSREEQTTLEPKLIEIGKPIISTTLDNGEMVTVVARVMEFDPNSLAFQDQRLRSFGNFAASKAGVTGGGLLPIPTDD